MAARLDLIHLCRHALPVRFLAGLAHRAGYVPTASALQNAAERPCLLAAWRVGTDGRLA